MKFSHLCTLLFVVNLCIGQIGVRLGSGLSEFDMWQEEYQLAVNNKNVKIFNANQSASLDYWFRLEKRRIEFLPMVGYSIFTSKSDNNLTFNGSSYNAAMNVNIYFMDLAEDCDCPTFSKEGGLLKKGIFFNVAPIVKAFTLKGNNATVTSKIKKIAPGLRIGLGLDIGISDLVTISPLLGYERTTMLNWENMSSILKPTTVEENIASNYGNTFAEVRMGMRFVKKNGFRRR
jgi:hypothetical protein